MIAGRRVVVTGRIAGESRQTAEAKLREAGAIVQSAVGKNTDVLVTGAAVGATKLKKARDLGVLVVPWEQAFGTNPAIGVAPPPREPAPAVRQWAPMLAKAGELPTDGDKWLYEVKWDGYRGIATVKDGAVTIQSRSGKSDLTERFPEIVGVLSKFTDCVLDGELVAIDGNGDSTFETLHRSQGATRYIVFDVLEVQGHGVTGMTLQGRRELLDKVVEQGTYIAISPAFNDGQELLDTVVERGLEGVVAKLRASRYVEGSRTEAWTKIKVRLEQEFAVVGYTPGEGARAGTFGALVLAVHDPNDDYEYRYVGKVGTGFDDADLATLMGRLEELAVTPVGVPPDLVSDLRDVVWCKPELVVQVEYQRWTEDGRLWHPSFKGIREDKKAREAVIA